MSSQSPSPERTLNRVVRAGVTVANAARRRRTRRRAGRRSPSPPQPIQPQQTAPHPPSTSFSDQILLTTFPSSPPDPHTRRRNDLRQTLLSFPEHDPSTVAALLNHYHGDRDRVIEKLSQARDAPLYLPSKPPAKPPQLSPPIQPTTMAQHQRLSPSLPQLPTSPPPLTLATTPRHHRRPSRRFSREAAAPLWAAAVRTAATSDAGGVASSARTHPLTPRVVGSKRPRHSQTASDTTDSAVIPSPDLYHSPATTHSSPAAAISTATVASSIVPPATPLDIPEAQPETVQRLLRRVADLEAALSRYTEATETGREHVGRRMQSAELEMHALDERHKTLEHDLDENQRRVIKTEQYLDTMRRDVRYAIGGRDSRFFVIVRQGVNGLGFYLLSYLVPVLFFLAKSIRSIVIAIRRRMGVQQ